MSDEKTEELILGAAREVFMSKGLAGARMQEIADKAGINKALLHYYFRSKEKLFQIIMKENMGQFMQVIEQLVNNKETSIDEKIEALVNNYIDMLLKVPDMPLFVLSNVKENLGHLKLRQKFMGSYFMAQISEAMEKKEIVKMHPIHIMLNVIGLTIFPFVARNIFQNDTGISIEEFKRLMEERKKLVPQWIKTILYTK